MKQDTRYKTIIEDMIREYQDDPSPRQSRLYYIIAAHLDEESEEEINERLKMVNKDDN